MPGAQTAGAQAQVAVPPVQVTALKQNHSGASEMQIERGMVVTQVVNASARQLIEAAYGVQANRITGDPAWAGKTHYDLTYSGGALSSAGTSAALQKILADQFHLVVQQQSRSTPVYAMVVAKSGPKFKEPALPQTPDTGEAQAISRLSIDDGHGEIALTGSVGALADALRSEVDRPIVDRTGLTGTYKIDFHWNAEKASAKSIAAELQQQLGLNLLPQSSELPAITIQSMEQPAEM